MQSGRQFRYLAILIISLLALAALATAAGGQPSGGPVAYLPAVHWAKPPMADEVRGLWVTRFDWTDYGQPAQPSRITEIVDDASRAGFNAIFFQVRGVADAYYRPGPEPWAQRVSGIALGVAPNPAWDPLAYFIDQAHQKGIQLHAYINVYPVWNPCNEAPPHTNPEHFYYKLIAEHGITNGKPNGLQWNADAGRSLSCETYLRATPASGFGDDHYLAVARYLADNYAIDGLHLDHIRYGGSITSCDPVSAFSSGVPCFQKPANYNSYQDWQRAQVNGTVDEFYQLIERDHPELMLSAAVWPTYIDRWGWGYTEGYFDYYQDSQGWIKGGYIDALMPMIYSSTDKNPDPNQQNFRLERWQTLVDDYERNNGGRFVIAGVGSNHYSSFAGIEERIDIARQLGTAGHAIFSYGGLDDPDGDGNPDNDPDYFQLLADGPYAQPAAFPKMSWR